MQRFALILLAGGVVLLVSWIAAPAAPSPVATAAIDEDKLDQAAPVVAEVNAQVERLREKLATPPAYPSPARNPFRFGRRVEPRSVPAARTPEPPPPVIAPSLPLLVAITATPVDGRTVRTAVLRVGDDVRIVKDGDSVGPFLVRAIREDAVELVDAATAQPYRLTLR